MKISFIATASYPVPPPKYGGEAFWWDLCECFAKLGHEVTLYAAAGSKCPPNGILHYIPEQYNPQGAQYVSADPMRILYRRDVLASDFIIDASHTKTTMEEIAYFHREAKYKTIGILNGMVSHTPMCPRYNMVVGSKKWQEMLESGLTQFADTPWEAQYGRYLHPMPKGAIIDSIHWACNTDFYTPQAVVDGHGDASYVKEDYYLWFSRPTGYKGCIPKGHDIEVDSGITEISNLKPQSSIRGQDGLYHKVLETMVRPYSGNLIKVTPYFINFMTKLTPEHPVLAIKIKRHSDRICRQSVRCQKRGCATKYKPEWVPAGALTKDHYLLYPKKKTVEPQKQLDLYKLLPNTIKVGGHLYAKGINQYGGEQRCGHAVNQILTIDSDLLMFAGWFIAEGHSGRDGIGFSLGKHEAEIAEKLKSIGERKFNVVGHIRRPKGRNVISVNFNSILIGQVFNLWFGKGAHNKRIPDWIMYQSAEDLKEFIRALWSGDGCFSVKRFSFGTVSKELLWQLFSLLTTYSITPHIGEMRPLPKRCTDKAYYIQILGKDDVYKMADIMQRTVSLKQRRNYCKALGLENYMAVPIRKLETEEFTGDVFNCETEEGSYIVNGIIVHNCGRAIEIAKRTKIHLKIAMPMDLPEHKYFGEEYLKQIADANANGAQIEFVKLPNNSQHHEAKRELYRKAKALLFTIESHEPFGLTVVEALSCGTPVLATRVGAMPEIIAQGVNGYLIGMEGPAKDPQNINSWQRAIGWIEDGLINPEDCRKDAVARFDRMVAAKRYLALYLRLANEHYGRPKVEITEDRK